jgi:glycosyltransferase involved in cell wall biosynthesis
MRILKEKDIVKNISLTIIGNGPLKQGLIALTQQYQLGKYIIFVDHLPYKDLHQELLKYHIFVHPIALQR